MAEIEFECSCGQLTPFHWLYLCSHCSKSNCRKCAPIEFVNYYCPMCLVTFTNMARQSDVNRCSKSCFSCPVCQSVMTQFSLGEGSFCLSCSYCHWVYTFSNVDPQKPNEIMAQIQEKEQKSAQAKEFQKSKLFCEQNSRPKKAFLPQKGKESSQESFTNPISEPFEGAQPFELLPQRVHLKAKKARKCRNCSHYLTKPEPSIKNVAWSSIPRVDVGELPNERFQLQGDSKFLLKFTNPRDAVAQIRLTLLSSNFKLHYLAKDFEIGAFDQFLEFDAEEGGEVKSLPAGVNSKGANSTSISIASSPNAQPASHFEATFQMEVTYKIQTQTFSFVVKFQPNSA